MKRILAVMVLALGVVIWPRVEAQRPLFTTGTEAEVAQARSLGLDHMRAVAQLKGIDGPNDLMVTEAHIDRGSIAHTRVQQYHRGIPVFGGQAISHLNADGAALGETDDLVTGISVDTTPRLTPDAAIGIATNDYGCSTCLTDTPKADLWILRHEGVDHLVYRVQLRRIDGSNEMAKPVRFVDAHGGYVVMGYDDLQTATGSSLYSGTVSIGTYFNAGSMDYAMQNLGLRVGTFDMRNTNNSYWVFDDPDNIWNGATQRAGVDAHYGMERYFAFLSSVFGRNGIDGSGGPFFALGDDGATTVVSSFVHGGVNYNNAFWDGYMLYGDGDGTQFGPLVTVDIAGHEMTHGVTQYTAGLIYQGESGALNESWSDVFGAMLERSLVGESGNTWLLGEQAYTPATAGDALRFLDNPHQASNKGFTADDDPDHYNERYTGASDNGGVHINSGISNKVFYLLAKGGSHHLGGSMTGIGADDAARIWFSALNSYMTSSTNFAGARAATLQAANAIFGANSAQYTGVENAWCLAGIGACHVTVEVQAISITPNSGTGVQQTFTLAYSDSAGVAADLTAAQVRFLRTDGGAGTCVVHYRGTTNQVRMQDDMGGWTPYTTFGAGTLANSYCSLNLATSSAAPSGNNLTLTLALTFTSSFGGTKDVQMRANSATGATTGWVSRGAWTVGGVVQAVSATPNTGTGVAQTFALAFSDSLGATADLKSAQVRFGATNVATSVCTVMYNAMTAKVRIQDDAGVNGPWLSLGSGTLSNSQCTVDLTQSSATPSGNNLTLNLHITFKATFGGLKNIYMRANSNYGNNSGWQTRGTWTVASTLAVVSVTPNADTGAARTFALAYTDSAGVAADLKQAQVRFATASNLATNVCTVIYNAMTGLARIHDDAGVAGPWTALGSGSLSNSQCVVDLAQSTAVPSGNNLTLNLRIAFKAAFLGAKNIYMRAQSNFGNNTGWQARGTFTVGATVGATSITPNSGSGSAQVFALAFTDSAGVTDDLKVARVRFKGATGPLCTIDYNAMTNLVRIQNDAGVLGPFTPFGAGTLSNSQCSLNLAASGAVRSGTDLTLTLGLTFTSGAFSGSKTVALRANSNLGPTTGFVDRGTWMVP